MPALYSEPLGAPTLGCHLFIPSTWASPNLADLFPVDHLVRQICASLSGLPLEITSLTEPPTRCLTLHAQQEGLHETTQGAGLTSSAHGNS